MFYKWGKRKVYHSYDEEGNHLSSDGFVFIIEKEIYDRSYIIKTIKSKMQPAKYEFPLMWYAWGKHFKQVYRLLKNNYQNIAFFVDVEPEDKVSFGLAGITSLNRINPEIIDKVTLHHITSERQIPETKTYATILNSKLFSMLQSGYFRKVVITDELLYFVDDKDFFRTIGGALMKEGE